MTGMDAMQGPQWQQLPLPGTEDMREALPHEQTEHQFMNRPNIFVHGRYAAPGGETRLEELPYRIHAGWHAGTTRAAHEAVQSLGPGMSGRKASFFHGEVDPKQMKNTQEKPISDSGEMWDVGHMDKYYKNTEEDVGSTSVILSEHPDTERPNNFRTHRESVSNAMDTGQHVPSHVRAVYEATGGQEGPEGYHHPDFEEPIRKKRKALQPQLFHPGPKAPRGIR